MCAYIYAHVYFLAVSAKATMTPIANDIPTAVSTSSTQILVSKSTQKEVVSKSTKRKIPWLGGKG